MWFVVKCNGSRRKEGERKRETISLELSCVSTRLNRFKMQCKKEHTIALPFANERASVRAAAATVAASPARQAGTRQERGARETNKITGDVGMEIGFHCKLIVLLLSVVVVVVVVVLNGLILVVPALAFGKEKFQYVQESNIR
uniref:Uncharacterized protein n=1 Tax=Trichogramma kaykai TaxID=54128 RepID=A0ABD2WQ85_9HYME